MGGEIVEDDDVSRLEGRGQLGLDISFEDFAVHGRIDDEGRREACRCQGVDEGLRLPVMGWTPPDGIDVPRWWC